MPARCTSCNGAVHPLGSPVVALPWQREMPVESPLMRFTVTHFTLSYLKGPPLMDVYGFLFSLVGFLMFYICWCHGEIFWSFPHFLNNVSGKTNVFCISGLNSFAIIPLYLDYILPLWTPNPCWYSLSGCLMRVFTKIRITMLIDLAQHLFSDS